MSSCLDCLPLINHTLFMDIWEITARQTKYIHFSWPARKEMPLATLGLPATYWHLMSKRNTKGWSPFTSSFRAVLSCSTTQPVSTCNLVGMYSTGSRCERLRHVLPKCITASAPTCSAATSSTQQLCEEDWFQDLHYINLSIMTFDVCPCTVMSHSSTSSTHIIYHILVYILISCVVASKPSQTALSPLLKLFLPYHACQTTHVLRALDICEGEICE